MTDTELERRLRDLLPGDTVPGGSGPAIDAGRAWRDFQLRRARSRRNRRRGLMASASVVAAAAVAVAAGAMATRGGSGAAPAPSAGGNGRPPAPRAYPGAVVARIGLGGVISLASAGQTLWVVRADATPGAGGSYQLARIDLRANKVTLRSTLGTQPEAIAAGGGAVWLTTSAGQARGQIVRLDPASGKVVATLHLVAGRCTRIGYRAGWLWAGCGADRGAALDFLRIDPATGRVDWRAGPVPGQLDQLAVGPRSVWYTAYYSGIYGLLGVPGRARSITVDDRGYPVSFDNTQGLVYADGSVWAITSDESVARIDPVSGRVVRAYTYRSYDPGYLGGLDYLAVGNGSLWFLDDGYPFSGVLRVSIATGRPVGRVPGIPPGSCGQQACSQIYFTPGAVWVPTLQTLIRIDPARLQG